MKFDIKDELLRHASILECINDYDIEIGVISGPQRDKDSKSDITKLEITNAQLMFYHEHGSPLKHYPARPVLAMTIEYANTHLLSKTIDNCIDGVFNRKWSRKEIEFELQILCNKMQNYARRLIYSNDGRLAPNAPSTEKAKGFNHPLFNTGQLAKSITCRLVKK